MKNQNQQVTLTKNEIEYIYTCWKQLYSQAYENFEDYLGVAIRGKEIRGTIYA